MLNRDNHSIHRQRHISAYSFNTLPLSGSLLNQDIFSIIKRIAIMRQTSFYGNSDEPRDAPFPLYSASECVIGTRPASLLKTGSMDLAARRFITCAGSWHSSASSSCNNFFLLILLLCICIYVLHCLRTNCNLLFEDLLYIYSKISRFSRRSAKLHLLVLNRDYH